LCIAAIARALKISQAVVPRYPLPTSRSEGIVPSANNLAAIRVSLEVADVILID
jgi:hypothetical protein